MAIHFGLELVNGKDNIRDLPKAADSGIWTAGDLLTLDGSGKVDPRTAAAGDSSTLEDLFAAVALTTEVTDADAETNNVHVPVMVITPEQIWSIKVEDLKRASDYLIGAGYYIGYIGTAVDYDIDYPSGGTSRTVSVDETYYLVNTAAGTAAHGAIVVAHPNRGAGADLNYGGRVHVRFGVLACQQIEG